MRTSAASAGSRRGSARRSGVQRLKVHTRDDTGSVHEAGATGTRSLATVLERTLTEIQLRGLSD